MGGDLSSEPILANAKDRLDGKIAIVTGAGSGRTGMTIGAAIAIAFARAGAAVCVADLDAERAHQTRGIVERAGGEALVVVGDTTSEDDCARIVAETVARYGGLHTLVNNVGVAGGGAPLEDLDTALWQRIVHVNLKSPLLMSRQAVAHLAGSGGSIVNIASIAGIRAAGGSAYGPSKAAVIQLGAELAVMYGRRGVRVNVIAPGHLYTPSVAAVVSDEQRELRRRIAPLGIEGTAWDVAMAALFLASDEARFLTGVCLPVDGGATVTMPLTASQRFAGDEL